MVVVVPTALFCLCKAAALIVFLRPELPPAALCPPVTSSCPCSSQRGVSGQDNRRDVEKRASQRTVISGNIWECTVNLSLGVTSSFLHGIVLLTAPTRAAPGL